MILDREIIHQWESESAWAAIRKDLHESVDGVIESVIRKHEFDMGSGRLFVGNGGGWNSEIRIPERWEIKNEWIDNHDHSRLI